MNVTRRMTPSDNVKVETRADGTSAITGYAAVFHRADDPGTQYQLSSDLIERIAPTAFNRAISDKHDVRGLLNHDSNFVLGRTSSGTMRLSVDSNGLRYEIDHNPNDPQHVSVLEKLKRGDLTGSSFAFQVVKQTFQRGDKMHTRTIEDVNLLDVGPVTYPAYEATTTGLRSGECDDAMQAFAKWQKETEAEAVAVRMRLLSLDSM